MTKQRVVTCPNRLSGTNVMIGGFIPGGGDGMRTAYSVGALAHGREKQQSEIETTVLPSRA